MCFWSGSYISAEPLIPRLKSAVFSVHRFRPTSVSIHFEFIPLYSLSYARGLVINDMHHFHPEIVPLCWLSHQLFYLDAKM